jgi:hypothetical protein
MQPQPIANETYYCLFAPDGTWQPSTLADDYATCLAFIRLLHKSKMSKSFFELTRAGFQVLPVSLSMTPTGTAEDSFQAGKAVAR